MINEYINAVLLGFGLAFMVGPVFFTLIETSITKGFRAALTFDLGVVLADAMFITISYFGSVTILQKIQDDPRIFMIGGFVLVCYGLYTIFYQKTKKIVTDKDLVVVESNNYPGLFLKGFFLNTINFGMLAFWLAVVIAVSSNFQVDSGKVFNYFAVVIITFLLTDVVKILAAKQLKEKLTPVVLRKIRHVLGIFFIVFGIILATKRYIPQKTIDRIDNVIEKVRS
ncbi:LysE family translocator [Lutimonas vermicola]|uniref:LysE family transporter n=1 Tax=Lutimonas vermicola TaxID=414288 RepID=A0ABU9L4J0_9FLAO